MYLTGEFPTVKGEVVFRQPQGTSEARWMVDIIYILEIVEPETFEIFYRSD